MKNPPSIVRRNPGAAFTLIEILVVIAIIAVLAALIFPVYSRIVKQAEVSESVSRMRNIGQAVQLFASDNDLAFPGGGFGGGGQPLIRWMHLVAPYMGYDADGSFEGVSYSTKGYSSELDDLFTCPALTGKSKPDGNGTYFGRYGMNLELTGDKTMKGVKMASISSPSKTVLLATKAQNAPGLRPLVYPKHQFGVAANFRPDRNPEGGVDSSGKTGPVGYLFCDGHVGVLDEFIGADAFYVDGKKP